MEYEKEKDVAIFSECVEFERDRITVSVFKYNEGDSKIQISREKKYVKTGWRFHKLGRMTGEEANKVIPVLEKAIAAA